MLISFVILLNFFFESHKCQPSCCFCSESRQPKQYIDCFEQYCFFVVFVQQMLSHIDRNLLEIRYNLTLMRDLWSGSETLIKIDTGTSSVCLESINNV